MSEIEHCKIDIPSVSESQEYRIASMDSIRAVPLELRYG
jgi:hypothetical protein